MPNRVGTVADDSLPRSAAPLMVQLPSELADFFDASGYSGSVVTEDRITSRLSARCETTIQFTHTPLSLLDAISERPTVGTVLLKDLSKTGLCLLFHEQIYPTERARIFLHGRELQVTFQRCRRLGPMCYEAGAAVDLVRSK